MNTGTAKDTILKPSGLRLKSSPDERVTINISIKKCFSERYKFLKANHIDIVGHVKEAVCKEIDRVHEMAVDEGIIRFESD
jgi:hypothetical protein